MTGNEAHEHVLKVFHAISIAQTSYSSHSATPQATPQAMQYQAMLEKARIVRSKGATLFLGQFEPKGKTSSLWQRN